jgi:hypothetical protein
LELAHPYPMGLLYDRDREAGYSDWAEVVLKPSNVKMATVKYKSGARKKITEQGYTVVASVGGGTD